MRKVANLSGTEREELFLVTARERALPEAVVEKDFWVCWTLDYLFHDSTAWPLRAAPACPSALI